MTDSTADSFIPWSPENATGFLESAQALARAILRHAEVTATDATDAAVAEQTRRLRLFEASDELAKVMHRHGRAQFQYTGSGFPYGVLAKYLSEDQEIYDRAVVAGEGW